jgi:hypothetical protein
MSNAARFGGPLCFASLSSSQGNSQMKNQILPGNTTDVAAPYAVTSGGGCLVGSLFGIAAYDAANGATVTLHHVGTFTCC